MKYYFLNVLVLQFKRTTNKEKMATVNNISLYIKRADLYQTKEFIVEAFASNSIGIVKDVKFIGKADTFGREYNGAIVVFDTWFMNAKVTELLDNISASANGSVKFVYDYCGHYWFINIYKPILPECEKLTIVDPSLPDKQRIDELERIVQTMMAQMHNMQLRQEYLERQLMSSEEKMSRQSLLNIDLRSQLEDKEIEIMSLQKEHNYKPNTSKMTVNELV